MPKVTYTENKGLVQETGGGISLVTPRELVKWNYISCASPVVSWNQTAAASVGGSGDQMGMLLPDANGNLRSCELYRVAAFTAAGDTPRIEGTVPATDTAATAAGLNVQLDHNATDNCGAEMHFGGSCFGNNVNSYTVGTHYGHIDMTVHTAAYDDWDKIAIGFRKVEAFNAAAASALTTADGTYTDFCELGAYASEKIETRTDINGTGTTINTDSTNVAVDNQNLRLRLILNKDRSVSYKFVVNAVAGAGTLAEPTTVVAYSFDAGDTVVPYIVWHGAGTDDVALLLKDVEIVRNPRNPATFR